jgi:hypothetical protein
MKNAIFCDVTYYFFAAPQLVVTASVVASPFLVTLMKEAIRPSETSVLTGAARHKIPEDDILR